MKTIIEMAREADLIDDTYQSDWYVYQLSRFADLVTEQANARANTSWTLMCKKMVAAENEACAKVCEARGVQFYSYSEVAGECYGLAAAIRARGNT